MPTLYNQYVYKDNDWKLIGTSANMPSPSDTSPLMDGTADAGSSSNFARGDHVHPTDTSRQATITASGILKGDGSGGVSAATAGTDYVAPSALSIYMQKGVDYVTAGKKSNTTLGTKATAEGINTTASGDYSHAEGYICVASNESSHAEGDGAEASGSSSHAEGSDTTASGDYSHAEGSDTTSSGTYSHAEGNTTTASSTTAHSEGSYTTASGFSSHAEGNHTTANHKSQHVFGEFNVIDTSTALATDRGNYVEIVGNGTAGTARSNARTLDWSGNETLAGKLTVGAGPTNAMDVATKQYVDSAAGSSSKYITNPAITASSGVFTWSISASDAFSSANIVISLYEVSTGKISYSDIVVNQSTGAIIITIPDTNSTGSLSAGTYKAVIIG